MTIHNQITASGWYVPSRIPQVDASSSRQDSRLDRTASPAPLPIQMMPSTSQENIHSGESIIATFNNNTRFMEGFL